MQVLIDNWDLVLRAFGYTVSLFLVAGVLSMLFGTLLAALRVGPIAVTSKAAALYVTVVRNTPLLMVFMFMAGAAPRLAEFLNFSWFKVEVGGYDFSATWLAGVIALTLYTSCFVCEALRSGINAVDLGQAEAARAIGLPFGGVMRNVVLPQTFRASVPPMASTLIALLKNTSVAAGFGIAEAVAQMRGLTNNYAGDRWMIFLGFAIIYVLLVELVSLASAGVERRWRIV